MVLSAAAAVALLPLLCVQARAQESVGGAGAPTFAPAFNGLPITQDIATTVVNPIAVRGGVLLLPLVRRSAEVAWPITIELTMGDGRSLSGKVVRIVARDGSHAKWTAPARVVGTGPPEGDGEIALLAPLPTDGDDSLHLGTQEVDAIWMDPLAPPSGPPREEPDLGESDTPDSSAPNEHFRAVLQAHRFGMQPPAPHAEGTDGLYARAIAGLWSAAIARLAEQDPVLAELVVSDLVGRARGSDAMAALSLAAWETSDTELSQLLRVLLEPRVAGIVLVESARAWIEGRSPLAIWVEHDEGEALVVAVANPRSAAVTLQLRWPDRNDALFEGEIPPESIEFVRVERPRWVDNDGPIIDEALAVAMEERGLGRLIPPANRLGASAPRSAVESEARAPRILLAESDTTSQPIMVGSGRIAVRPPGVGLGTLIPSANLAAIRGGALRGPPVEWSTNVGLRKRPTGWELILECRVPEGAAPTIDEVTVTVDAGFLHTVRVSSSGQIIAGNESVEDGGRVARHRDRWRARVPLPDEWIVGDSGTPARVAISAQRRIEGAELDAPPAYARLQFAGIAPRGTDPKAKAIPVDLSSWSFASVTLSP